MGCDIHCHLEVKVNGQWHHWSEPQVDRDYSLFARMADVRRHGSHPPAIAPPRGLVADPTIPTEIDWQNGDGDWHTPSWLTGAELEMLIRERLNEVEARAKEIEQERMYSHPWRSWRRGGFGYLFGNGFDVLAEPGDYPDCVEDCRLVFWFDN